MWCYHFEFCMAALQCTLVAGLDMIPGACSTAHRSNRPDHWDGLMLELDRSAVGQLSSLSSRTKWQRLPADDTLRLSKSNIRPSQWSGLFDRWAVEHAPGVMHAAVGLWKHRRSDRWRDADAECTMPEATAAAAGAAWGRLRLASSSEWRSVDDQTVLMSIHCANVFNRGSE